MRRITSTAILRLLILFGALCSFSAFSQSTVLVPLNQEFRYHYSGDPGPAWRNRGFDDSTWQSGGTLIGYEDSGGAVYPEPITTPLPQPGGTITHYFRTTFNAPGTANANTIFFLTNWIDDGAVFYINGAEVARLRMPAGAINNQTLASGGPGTEGQTDIITFGYTNFTLFASGNVLAVEVHQNSTTSSDIVFGSILTREIPTPVVITSQPEDLTVVSNAPATFVVGVSGSTPSYRWYKDGFAVANGTNSSLTIGNARQNNAGNYYVIVSNKVNSVTSRVARLSIIADIFSPELLSAIVQPTTVYSNKVDVRFVEPAGLSNITANFTNNYTVTTFPASSPAIKVIGAQHSPATATVRLTIDREWDETKTYIITVSGVRDNVGNMIKPKSQVGIEFTVIKSVFGMSDHSWMLVQPFSEPIGWKEPNYVEDASWAGPANGVFYYDQNVWTPCSGVRNWEVSIGYPSTYFRTKFVVTNVPPSATLRMNYLIDDGAVFYLNGKEIHRFWMPPGTPEYDTLSTTNQTGNPPPCNLVSVAVTNLINGTNTLAVELHQGAGDVTDVAFGLDLDVSYNTLPFQFPTLNVVRTNNTMRVFWPGAPWKLEVKTNLGSTTWTRLNATTNFFSTNVLSGQQRYFRVVQP